MEQLEFRLASKANPVAVGGAAICGVVGSGNLEVLVRPSAVADECTVTIHTSARGFDTIWQAVLQDFAEANAAGGLALSINDMGATPAVVALRLAQALALYTGGNNHAA